MTSSGLDLELKQFSAEENYESFDLQLDELLGKYHTDLIYSIGGRCTQAIKRKTEQAGRLIPIVFGAVRDPVGAGLVKNEVYSGNHLTGITANEGKTYDRDFVDVLSLIPGVKKVLYLCDRSLKENREQSERILPLLNQIGKNVTLFSVNSRSRITEAIYSNYSSIDLILIMRETHLKQQFDELADISTRFNIPVFSADRETVFNGLPFGYSFDERKTGAQTAAKGLSILDCGIVPETFRIQSMNTKYRLFVNRKVAIALKVELDSLKKIKTGRVEFV